MSKNRKCRFILLLSLVAAVQSSLAQRFVLFSQELKTECPSVVYDFLETYLYEIDSLQRNGVMVDQQLRDDKVIFMKGTAKEARQINPSTPFQITKFDNKYYEIVWKDSAENSILDVAFPMQYELLLGKSKVDVENELQKTLSEYGDYSFLIQPQGDLILTDDSCLMSNPISHYYVESVNTATYYTKTANGEIIPTFKEDDKWHSAANLFHGLIEDVADYNLYVEQNLYGFKKSNYLVPLQKWLAYCQAMKLTIYFAIEEEREDGLKALLIAQSQDLGFNHVLSIIIPDDFVTKKNSVLKATLYAYIPTQNVKDLYQQYVEKPKKKI